MHPEKTETILRTFCVFYIYMLFIERGNGV